MTDIVETLAEELSLNPRRFKATCGYDRLPDALERGHPPDAVKRLLHERTDLAGPLLSTLVELNSPAPFVPEARASLSHPDRAVAWDAMSIVVGWGSAVENLRAALAQLPACDESLLFAAAGSFGRHGLFATRLNVAALGSTWALALAERLQTSVPHAEVEELLASSALEKQVVGAGLVTLGRGKDPALLDLLLRAEASWLRAYGESLAFR